MPTFQDYVESSIYTYEKNHRFQQPQRYLKLSHVFDLAFYAIYIFFQTMLTAKNKTTHNSNQTHTQGHTKRTVYYRSLLHSNAHPNGKNGLKNPRLVQRLSYSACNSDNPIRLHHKKYTCAQKTTSTVWRLSIILNLYKNSEGRSVFFTRSRIRRKCG